MKNDDSTHLLICTSCKEDKPMEAYSYWHCDECRRAARRKSYHKNIEQQRALARERYHANKDKPKASKDYALRLSVARDGL